MSKRTPTYPLIDDTEAQIAAASGRPLTDITVENVMQETLDSHDMRIRGDTLRQQAQIAQQSGYGQLAANLTRAAELVDVPNDEMLRMYEVLRPHRASYSILQALAATLEQKYSAPMNAKLVREAADAYRERGLLRRE